MSRTHALLVLWCLLAGAAVADWGLGTDVCRVDVATGEIVQLTREVVALTGTRFAVEPALSPDGTHLAYVVWTGRSFDLWVAGADGTGPLLAVGDVSARFAWASSSAALVCAKAIKGTPDAQGEVPELGYRLLRYDVASGDTRQLAEGAAQFVTGLVCSPTAELVCVGWGGVPHDGSCVQVLAEDGSEVLHIAGWGWPLAWSKDGQRLALGRKPDGSGWNSRSPEIPLVVTDGSHETTLAGQHPSTVDWSPDGELLLGTDDSAVYALPAGGGPRRDLVLLSAVDAVLGIAPDYKWLSLSSARWCPDGTHIALLASDQEAACSYVLVSGADGSDLHLAAVAPGSQDGPSWTPEGGGLLFTRMADAATSFPTEVTVSSRRHGVPADAPWQAVGRGTHLALPLACDLRIDADPAWDPQVLRDVLGAIDPFVKQMWLRGLSLRDCTWVTDAVLDAVTQGKIRWLDVSGCTALTDEGTSKVRDRLSNGGKNACEIVR